jgi:hypothetical protein
MTNYIPLLWDSLMMHDCQHYYAQKSFVFIEWQTTYPRLANDSYTINCQGIFRFIY